MNEDLSVVQHHLGGVLRSHYAPAVEGAEPIQAESYSKLIHIFDMIYNFPDEEIAERVLRRLDAGDVLDAAGQYEILKYIVAGSAMETALVHRLLCSSSIKWTNWPVLVKALSEKSPWHRLIQRMMVLSQIESVRPA